MEVMEKTIIYLTAYRKRHCMLPTERAGKAMHAVSGRDTGYTRPKPA